MPVPKFVATAVQSDIRVVPEGCDGQTRDRIIRENLERNMELVAYLHSDPRYGGPKLVAFPEFGLCGIPETRSWENYHGRAVSLPGWVTEIAGKTARKFGCYVVLNTFERDDKDWPDHVFNTGFIVGPDGDLKLRYRKNNDTQPGWYRTTNPGDILAAYAAKYGGIEALFPVLKTEYGNMACYTDVGHGEEGRCFTLLGAEILIQCTGEAAGDPGRVVYKAAKQTRAWENACYLISVNGGLTLNSSRPVFRQGGASRIIDYQGRIMAEADVPGECVVSSLLDIELLREFRAAGGYNYLMYNRLDLYKQIFERFHLWPNDSYGASANTDRERAQKLRLSVRDSLIRQGIITPPATMKDETRGVFIT